MAEAAHIAADVKPISPDPHSQRSHARDRARTPRDQADAAEAEAADPYAFLDLVTDFAWRSADGRQAFVARLDDDAPPPDWLRRSASRRKRARLVNAASWMITAVVLAGVVGVAGIVMLGGDRFAPAVRELTGLDIAASPAGHRATPATAAAQTAGERAPAAARSAPAVSPVSTVVRSSP